MLFFSQGQKAKVTAVGRESGERGEEKEKSRCLLCPLFLALQINDISPGVHLPVMSNVRKAFVPKLDA